jgi:hypothetical protein
MVAPEPNGFVADIDATLEQQALDVQRLAEVHKHDRPYEFLQEA